MSESQERHHEHREQGEGARILHKLEQTGTYVFHGSASADISELETHQPYTWVDGVRQTDGAPCVAATIFADVAIFRALVHTDHTSFGQNEDGALHFEASQKALNAAQAQTGIVYVLLKSDFTPRHGEDQDMEWRANANMRPLQSVQVTARDLPPQIRLLPT